MAGGGECNPFHYCAMQMGKSVRGAEAEELRARVAVVAKPLTREIGHEEQTVGPSRRCRGPTRHFFISQRILVQRAARPAHCVAATLKKHERTPMPLDRRDIANLAVEQGRGGDERENA